MSNKSKDYLLVSIQFLLFAIYLWNPLKNNIFKDNFLNTFAIITFLIGVVVMLMAVYALRNSISPFPSPRENATLISAGIYHYVRHPIYTSILLTSAGWAIYSNSLFRAVVVLALFILFEIKSNFEEHLLIHRFKDYINYKKITGKYFPKIK